MSGFAASLLVAAGLVTGGASVASANTSNVTPAANPAMVNQCQIDLAITLDYSTSMNASQLTAQENAVKSLATALQGYPVRIALFNFGSNSPLDGSAGNAPLPLTSVETQAGVNAIHAKLDAFNRPSTQYTNWQAAFDAVRTSVNPAVDSYDVLAFVTDGNPTRNSAGNQNTSDSPVNQAIVDAGVTAANLLKADGTRIVGVAVTDNLSTSGYNAMLRQIPQVTGPVQGSDYLLSGLAGLQQNLLDIVNQNCATVDLEKTGELSADGTTIDYDFTVKNTGIVPLTDVRLADELEGISSITWGPWPNPAEEGVLQPDEEVTATATYTVTPDDRENGNVLNEAEASGLPPTGTTRATDEDTYDVPIPDPAEPPTTDAGTTTGPQGLPQSWEPTPVPGTAPIAPDTLTLLDASGDPTPSVAVSGQGVYTVVDGELVFTPEPQFIGTADPVTYRISDEGGLHAENTYTPTTTSVTPVANPDSSVGRVNEPQSVNPLLNDTPGNPGVPLVTFHAGTCRCGWRR